MDIAEAIEYRCDLCGGSSYTTDIPDVADNSGRAQELFSIVRCDSCGHFSTQPAPKPELMARYYPSQYYAHVDTAGTGKDRLKWYLKGKCYRGAAAGAEAVSVAMRGRLGRILAEPPPVANGRLLDVGCGAGEYVAFAQSQGWRVSGVETDDEAVEVGSKRGLDIVQGMAESLPFENCTFDVVRLWQVLEHTYSPTKVIAEINRIMKPGGHLLLSVPNFGGAQRRVLGKCWPHLDVPRHLHHFTAETLDRVLTAGGLRKVQNLYSGLPFFELRWRMAVCRLQGLDSASAVKLVLKSVISESAGRLAGNKDGVYLTWWVQKPV